jgi:hypothetical protein
MQGLQNSLCLLPVLSYGATAPLATLYETSSDGWPLNPIGLQRLSGQETDAEDAVLKVVRAFSSLYVSSSMFHPRQLTNSHGLQCNISVARVA